jgi:hypothetical protein
MLDFTEYIKYLGFMSKKRAKMGRPSLKAKNRRTALVTLRLKPSERKDLEKDAKTKGLSLSTYLLECWQRSRKYKK